MTQPRDDFHSVYALLPPAHGWEWVTVLQSEWQQHRFTIGGSADHAAYVPGISRRTVLALNPQVWGDLQGFFNTYYPNSTDSILEYVPITATTPEQWAAGVHAYYNPGAASSATPEIRDIRAALPVNTQSPWYPWARRGLGEITTLFVHHSAGSATSNLDEVFSIAAYHTARNGKDRPGICYTYIIGADGTTWQTSDLENVVFAQGSADYAGDENRYGVAVCLLGNFTAGRQPTTQQLAALEHLLTYIQTTLGRQLRVWGHKDVAQTECPGDGWPWKPAWGRRQTSASKPLLGFNDHPDPNGSASNWLRANNVQGFILRPIFLGGAGAALDFSVAEAAGQRVIVNLRYSWSTDCGGAGTLPQPGTPDWRAFVAAATYTINYSYGVWGWEIGNEYNNPREFPNGGILTPADVATTYNAIYAACHNARLAPGALDPFNAQAGDPRDWLRNIYGAIKGAYFVTAHGYIRGPDAGLVGSAYKFNDDPLRWQYLNYPGCVTALLDYLPNSYKYLPVYITEFNHMFKTQEPDWGWASDTRAGDVVEAAYAAAQRVGFAGLALYRWYGDQWAVYNNAHVLDAVKRIA